MSSSKKIDKKIEYFDAFLKEISDWYLDEYQSLDNNDLSKLKVLKLLFLGVAKDNSSLDVFNNFVAWDLGPVEKDIYESINSGSLLNFKIDNQRLIKKTSNTKYSDEAKSFGSIIVSFLREQNPNLIRLPASKLVDITHKWNSWSTTRLFGITNISKSLLESDRGYYS